MTTGAPAIIRVLLADDHRVLREGLRSLLDGQQDIRVVAEAGTSAEAIAQAVSLRPHIVVMDLGMPDMNGLEAIREIRRQCHEVRVVVLSMHSGREFVREAMQAGSDGYVPKSSAHTDLLEAIRVVHAGQRFLHPVAATALVDELLDTHREAQLLAQLSAREQEVLRWTAMGLTSREIGQRLSISQKTVDTYRQRAMEKLNLGHRADVVRFVLRAGLLDENDLDG